jgi:hypothetical protein
MSNLDTELTGLDPVPAANLKHFVTRFLNSGAENMAVGSGLPQVFTITVPSGQTWYLKALSFFIANAGGMASDKFGNTSALTTGVSLESQINGVAYTGDIVLRRNSDLAMTFSGGDSGGSSLFSGLYEVTPNVTLKNSTSDYIRWRVSEDLTASTYITAAAHFWRAT